MRILWARATHPTLMMRADQVRSHWKGETVPFIRSTVPQLPDYYAELAEPQENERVTKRDVDVATDPTLRSLREMYRAYAEAYPEHPTDDKRRKRDHASQRVDKAMYDAYWAGYRLGDIAKAIGRTGPWARIRIDRAEQAEVQREHRAKKLAWSREQMLVGHMAELADGWLPDWAKKGYE